MDHLEEIIRASKAGYSEASESIVEKIIAADWCSEECLLEGFEVIEDWGSPVAITFFQLPFPVMLPMPWVKLDLTNNIESSISFKIIGTDINEFSLGQDFSIKERNTFGDKDQYRNGWLPFDQTGQLLKTQVKIVFRLWRFWAEVFPSYESALTGGIKLNAPLPFRSGYAKDNGVTLSASKFEFDLAKRLRQEALWVLKKFLPIYAVASRNPIPTNIKYLHNFFTMVTGGRVIVLGPGHSMITQSVKPISDHIKKIDFSELDKYLSRKRTVSVYERYLLEAYKQIEIDCTSLVIVQTVMILDWFANEMLEEYFIKKLENSLGNKSPTSKIVIEKLWRKDIQSDIKVSVKDKFTRYFAAIGINIPPSMTKDLCAVIKQRNDIVHPKKSTVVSAEDALKAIDVGLRVIDYSLDCIFNQFGKKERG